MNETCKCYNCKEYQNGKCKMHKEIKIWIKPNTSLFNYNVDLRKCFTSK